MLGRRVTSILNFGANPVSISRTGRLALLSVVLLATSIIGPAALVAAPTVESAASSVSVGAEVSTPLIRASARGDNDEVLRLIGVGADVNQTSNDRGRDPELGRTALVAAARFGHVDVVRTLLDAGAPVDHVVRGDETALIAALRGDHLDVARLLIRRGADANLGVRGDGSPLIAAVRNDNVNSVRLLLDNGADPNMSVPGDENPLYHAAASRNEVVFDMLVGAGGDIRLALEDVASASGSAQ